MVLTFEVHPESTRPLYFNMKTSIHQIGFSIQLHNQLVVINSIDDFKKNEVDYFQTIFNFRLP